jgi:hypothetical protein
LGLHWSDVITAKVYTIDSMNNFPVIKKIEVPPHTSFFHRDLLQLVLDEDEFKALDGEDEVPYDRLDNDKPPQLRWKVNRS